MLRLRAALFATILSLVLRVWGQHYPSYNYGFDPETRVTRRQNSDPIVTEGVRQRNTQGDTVLSTAQRLEIRELQKNPVAWTLYILGLSYLQFMDQESDVSWYGLTGLQILLYLHRLLPI
jgi:tyrosinase